MSRSQEHLTPYSLLGVAQDAAALEIELAYQMKIAEAAGSPVLTAAAIESAYKILSDPRSRERLDRKPDGYAWRPATHRAGPARASRAKRAVLGGLLILLILCAYIFLVQGAGAVCPQCQHATLFRHEELRGQVTLSCTRAVCDYSYVYDKSADMDGPAKITE